MMTELIFRNLFHRPLRTLIGVVAVAVEVALVVLIVGLTSGLLTETAKRIEGIGADIMLQPPAASIFLGFSGSPMPIKIADKISNVLGVSTAPPADWSLERRREYLDWTEQVVAGCRGCNPALEDFYDEVLREGRQSASLQSPSQPSGNAPR
jgi:hypothetical protein